MSYKPDPNFLYRKAEQLLMEDELMGAYANYTKAANIYMVNGSYFRMYECYESIIHILKMQGRMGEAINILLENAKKLEDFNIYEVAAKFYEKSGILSYTMEDYESASMWYKDSARLYLEVFKQDDSDEMRELSGILLMKSAESLYQLKKKKESAENLMLEGVFRYFGLASKIPEMEDKLKTHLNNNEFIEARRISENLADIMKDMIEKMDITSDFQVELLSSNVESRLIHYKSEYLFIDYLILHNMGEKEELQKVRNRTLKKLNEGMDILHDILIKEHDKEDIIRYCFDGMLKEIIHALDDGDDYSFSHEQFIKDLTDEVRNEIEENEYFNIIKKINKYGLELTKNDLLDANLGKFHPIKSLIIKLIFP